MLIAWWRIFALIIRHPSFLIFRFGDFILLHSLHRLITHSPKDTILHQLQKSRVTECALIMSKSRIENPTLTMLFNPCIRLSVRAVYTFHQYFDIFGQEMVHIGFIPFSHKWRKPLHHRMIRLDDFSAKRTSSMALELTTN